MREVARRCGKVGEGVGRRGKESAREEEGRDVGDLEQVPDVLEVGRGGAVRPPDVGVARELAQDEPEEQEEDEQVPHHLRHQGVVTGSSKGHQGIIKGSSRAGGRRAGST